VLCQVLADVTRNSFSRGLDRKELSATETEFPRCVPPKRPLRPESNRRAGVDATFSLPEIEARSDIRAQDHDQVEVNPAGLLALYNDHGAPVPGLQDVSIETVKPPLGLPNLGDVIGKRESQKAKFFDTEFPR
jgi:hypothetical protein